MRSTFLPHFRYLIELGHVGLTDKLSLSGQSTKYHFGTHKRVILPIHSNILEGRKIFKESLMKESVSLIKESERLEESSMSVNADL